MYREQLRSFQYLIWLILESKPDSKLPQTSFSASAPPFRLRLRRDEVPKVHEPE
jgi:hypothetical protein